MACRLNRGATSFQQTAENLARAAHLTVSKSKETLRKLILEEGRAVLKAQRRGELAPDCYHLKATGQPRMTLDAHTAGLHGGHRGTVNCAVFAPDSNHVFTASDDGTVRQWNLATMQVEQKIDVDPQGVTRLVLSRDGQTLVTASRSGIAAIWRVADPREPQRLLRGHSGEILDLCLTDDNQWIVTASADNTARIWNLASGQEVLKLEGHSSEVTAVATLADERGLRILTGSNDKTAKLWAIRGLGGAVSGDANAQENPEAQELLSLRGHTRGLTSVDFAEGGRAALTAARDGLTIVWPAVPAARRGMPR